jgi:predicted ATPase
MMRLKKVSLLRDRVTRWDEYPFNIQSIATLDALEITSRVCFFTGENGTGKSTLLEAIAAHYGFGLEGGNRNFSPNTTGSVHSMEPLVKALRLSFTKRTGAGFYLRAESFFNVASYVDSAVGWDGYGGKSLHDQSHGESFISLLQNRFNRSGFYLMDEPEAALSPQRQLSLLVILHDLLADNENIQFLVATHSPILLAYPGAQILSFDGGEIHPISYQDSQPFQLVSRFLAAPERYMNALFSKTAETDS